MQFTLRSNHIDFLLILFSCLSLSLSLQLYSVNKLEMHISSAPMLPVKNRSQSMPRIQPAHAFQPIHKRRSSKKVKDEVENEVDNKLPIIPLLSLKNKEEEELKTKIKVIAQRNMKKIQQRYGTVDRWKQKYLSQSSTHCGNKQRQSYVQRHLETPQPESTHPNESEFQSKQKQSPVVATHAFMPNIPDHREQGRRLEAQLMTRLEKNKKYYQIKRKTESQRNYIGQSEEKTTPRTKKQQEQKQPYQEKKYKLAGLIHKKLLLREQNSELNFLRQHIKRKAKKQAPIKNPQLQQYKKVERLLQKSNSIFDFKQRLLQQAVQQTPAGWHNSAVIQQEFTLNND